MVALGLCTGLGAQETRPLSGQWATLTIEPQLRRNHIEIIFGTLRLDPVTKPLEYWIERRERRGSAETMAWADSRRCSPLHPLIAAMRDLEPLRPDPPGFNDDAALSLAVDGTLYRLEGSGRTGDRQSGRFSMSTNVGTPLAAWADRLEAELKPCWSSSRPTSKG
ncbi:MAG: hypothetical protein QM690_09270 [Sphingobium sp.]